MDKARLILSGSVVFHGDVNLHFHSHDEPTGKRTGRSDGSSSSKISGMTNSSKSGISVLRENSDGDDEAVSKDRGHSIAGKQLYHDHIGDEFYYQITHRPKGLVLLINNEFRGQRGWRREGSDIDVADMEKLWERMGCTVTTTKNLDVENMIDVIKSMVSRKKVVDFFVAIIMSHGAKDDFIIGADRGRAQVKHIVDTVAQSERLQNKPKLIFFQMCRGESVETDQIESIRFDTNDPSDQAQMTGIERDDDGNHVDSGPSRIQNGMDRLFYEEYSTWVNQLLNDILEKGRILGSVTDEVDNTSTEYIFKLPDVMLAFASQPDHVAFLTKEKGSWFIQSLKRVFTEYAATLDVVEMMKRVKEDVSKHVAYIPGSKYDNGKATLDASDTFGNKRLSLFPGFPKN